ncbi:MAG: hypothetical protein DHS20C14_21330 [Phycisphaeraceae bacterium]|nr:MAG: hypothetical protein DHS20C14_21330 [Phycisphaeraceae bacterium]
MTRCASEDRIPIKGVAWTCPDPVPVRIETPRLVVRAYEPSDARALHETVDGCRGSLLPWLPWSEKDHADEERSLHFILNQRVHLREPSKLEWVVFGVFERDTGTLVGGHGIHGVRRETASAETGYWLTPGARGKGYATEASAHVLSWAFRPQNRDGMGLNRVRIYCSHRNTASVDVPNRLGLREEVRQREDFYVEGLGLTDRLGWGVLAAEWDADTHRPRAT